MAPQVAESSHRELLIRLVSATVMIPPVLAAIYFGGIYFTALVGLGCLILFYELYTVCDRKIAWTIAGGTYVGVAAVALVSLRADIADGLTLTIWLFTLVWAADTGAYVLGRTIGGAKLAPKISPNKTWSGFAGALIFAGLAGWVAAFYLEIMSPWKMVSMSAILGGVSQLGDLLESWLKRRFHKKDMSGLIPGHGGLFDRADGLLAAAIATWIVDRSVGGRLLEWL